jgi:hypothetical protein
MKMDINKIESISSIIKNGFTVIAIIAGGIWTFFHYFKGRTFKPRLELKISGELQNNDNSKCLITKVRLKNVGLSKLEIKQKGTGMRIISIDEVPHSNKAKRLEGNRLRTVTIFKEHEWIEPNEIIDDVQVFLLPNKSKNILLDARVISKSIAWRAKCIASYSIEKEKNKDEFV